MEQKGLIMRSTGSWYEVRSEQDGGLFRGRLRGKHKLQQLKVTNPLAVGDYVHYVMENPTERTVAITEILDRENYIVRKSPHKLSHAHLLAANLDQALLLATLVLPRTSLGFIDRFLVSAESFRIPVVVVFNKSDLLDQEVLDYQAELCSLYNDLGYTSLQVSAEFDPDLGGLEDLLRGKKTLISGHSGVGKSTLVNRLAPGLGLRTSEVSRFANKGVHTTTFAEMYEIAPETFIIDTPGIKELGLADIGPEEIGHYFPEMRQLLNQCRFHNCLHQTEPGCAVLAQVERGQIALTRYESYVSMILNEDNRR
jgi:ribosome biogenesis GTPase / thiamine phosphate phosphatase